jgi:hypothetical protein
MKRALERQAPASAAPHTIEEERRPIHRKSSGKNRLCRPNRRPLRALCLTLGICLLPACTGAPKRPVFYPNAHLKAVGQAQARRDTDACIAMARKYDVAATKDGAVGEKATKGAVIGGVGAGAWGLFRGDAAERAAAGAVAGAATGATAGAFESTELSPTFKRFVDRCLAERGYDVIGWE